MNLAESFGSARPVAQHCPELTERGPRPEERAQFLAKWRRDVAREVAQDMADLLSGAKLEVALAEPEIARGAAVFERIGPVAANSLLRCGGDEQTALLSFSIETAIALTDRSFGGTGEAHDEPVTALTRSAALLVEQAARTIASAITRVSATSEQEGDVIIRSENAARLKPFTPSTKCALFVLSITADDGVSWTAILAMPIEELDHWLPGASTSVPANDDEPGESATEDRVFGAMPLRLQAILAEFELSLGELDRLSPGDRIPIAIARDIPLRLGTHLVASGSLGTLEDRIALKVTSPSVAALETQAVAEAGGVA